jgi:hypothetical protein
VISWPLPAHANPDAPRLAAQRPWVTFREAAEGLPIEPRRQIVAQRAQPAAGEHPALRSRAPDGGDRFEMERNLDRAGLGRLVFNCWRERPGQHTDVFGRLRWDRR